MAALSKSPRKPKSKKAYAAAGVDVDLGNRVKSGIQAMVKGTHGRKCSGASVDSGACFGRISKGCEIRCWYPLSMVWGRN